jgi:4-amino-4-deoxy-L-arabinose transferase-like glycosyltransferase
LTKAFPWLLLLILLALALRLAWLDGQSLWYDEGVTWWLAQMEMRALLQWTAADIQPPFYYLLMWASRHLYGESEWALRFPSVLFNILTIPLFYALARRLCVPALFAAGLLAISPVMVYYSQEARMYTLLIFEATVSSYLLLRVVAGDRRLFTLAYALTAALSLYTHYFAAFLLMAHALYFWLALWRQNFPRRLLAQGAQIVLLVTLLFGPWLPVLLARLGDDPSYWAGPFELVEATRKILIIFTLGPTVFEQTGFWLSLGYLAAFGLGLSQVLGRPGGTRGDAPLLILWLCLPIALILALSYQSPKFNPRYALLAWPAFALLLAAGLAWGSNPRLSCSSRLKPTRKAGFECVLTHLSDLACGLSRRASLIRLFAYSLILLTSAFSLCNWFADPRFSKDDFRAVAQFVRERQHNDETVLLSSGHLFPVWVYYYGRQGWTPLPQMERLDVTRVTDLSIAAEMAGALEGKGGVWLVSWQDEVIDPNGVVPFWLDLAGRRPGDAGDFWGVRLEHWRLLPGPTALLTQDPIRRPARFNFAGEVDLLGLTQLSDTEIALFWRRPPEGRQPLPPGLLMTLDLTDAAGFDWDEGTEVSTPGAAEYPPTRWPAGRVVLTRHTLTWRGGAPPGDYVLEVGLGQVDGTGFAGLDILDEQGRPQRRTALIPGLRLSRPIPLRTLPEASPLVEYPPFATLRQSSLSAQAAEPGDRLLLTLLWQAGPTPPNNLSFALDLVDAGGQIFPAGTFPLPAGGDWLLGQYWLDVPPGAAPGPATLRLALGDGDAIFPIGVLEILPTERVFVPPATLEMPLEANFSGQATLLGAECRPAGCRAAPGQAVTLTLYWRADGPMETHYTIFAHLLGPGEVVLVNADHAPPKPTRGWIAGEIIADVVALPLPADLASGEYTIEVGLYDAGDPAFVRLPLTAGGTRVLLPQPLTVE